MEESNAMKIGDRIKYERKKARVGQQDLAKRIGIYRTTLANYETNRTIPSVATIQLIAEALSVPFHKIANDRTNPFEPEQSTSNGKTAEMELEVKQSEPQNQYNAELKRLKEKLDYCHKLIGEYSITISRYRDKFGPLVNE